MHIAVYLCWLAYQLVSHAKQHVCHVLAVTQQQQPALWAAWSIMCRFTHNTCTALMVCTLDALENSADYAYTAFTFACQVTVLPFALCRSGLASHQLSEGGTCSTNNIGYTSCHAMAKVAGDVTKRHKQLA